MNLSSKGLALIQEFESYLKAQPDGSCKSYKCPAGVWTIGFGVTEGVGPDDHWTRAEADAAFAREMVKHEKAVQQLVTVSITQSQFDALVSFSYNVGAGALAKSTLLKKLNARDYLGAADEFRYFTRARDPKTGKKVVLKGLVRRRKAEAALFTSDMPGADDMPQAAEESRPVGVVIKDAIKDNKELIAIGATVTGSGGAAVATKTEDQAKPAAAKIDPKIALEKGKELKAQTETAKDLGTFAFQTYEWVKGPGMFPALFVIVPFVVLLIWARRRAA